MAYSSSSPSQPSYEGTLTLGPRFWTLDPPAPAPVSSTPWLGGTNRSRNLGRSGSSDADDLDAAAAKGAATSASAVFALGGTARRDAASSKKDWKKSPRPRRWYDRSASRCFASFASRTTSSPSLAATGARIPSTVDSNASLSNSPSFPSPSTRASPRSASVALDATASGSSDPPANSPLGRVSTRTARPAKSTASAAGSSTPGGKASSDTWKPLCHSRSPPSSPGALPLDDPPSRRRIASSSLPKHDRPPSTPAVSPSTMESSSPYASAVGHPSSAPPFAGVALAAPLSSKSPR